jgi:GntR family transcriptional repressor for pyruvate dehydrogenase complex
MADTLIHDLKPIDFSRREPVSAEVTQRLLAYLLSGRFQPGEKIPPERKLAESLGVGRYVVREALKSLAILGLVEVRLGDGTYLRATSSDLLPQVIEWGVLLTPQQRRDIEEARYYIEPIVAGLAAERRDEKTVRKLKAVLDDMSNTLDRRTLVEGDLRFHTILADASGNAALGRVVASLRSLLRVWMGRVTETIADPRPGFGEHTAIYEAVARGDAPAARKAAAHHCKQAVLRWEALEAASAPAPGAPQEAAGGATAAPERRSRGRKVATPTSNP